MAATLLLAAISLIVSYAMFAERIDLLQRGRQTEGIVVGTDVGVKGLKKVEVEFVAVDGRRLIGRDIHATQWLDANEIGDEVVLYHDPFYEGEGKPDILVARGVRIWFNPAFLLGGGILLLWLGVYLARQQRKDGGE
jgi:hypothetical protein